MLNAAAPYRRDSRPAVRVPVVMPSVEVTVDPKGYLTITLDREPYSTQDAFRRDDLKRVLDQIAADLGTPVRVEVHEADGSVFTDILTPPRRAPDAPQVAKKTPAPAPDVSALDVSAFGISGEGFTAGEQVDVCVIVARQTADDDGIARLRLPPALLADHPDVVLVGRTSRAVALSEGAA